MARNSRTLAADQIASELSRGPGGVFMEGTLRKLLDENREAWGLGQSLSFQQFLEFCVEELGLRRLQLRAEKYAPITRYAWKDYSPQSLALSLRPGSYLSHGTAVLLHGLNDQLPKTIYANKEQSAKPTGGKLTQDRLTLAFTHRQRVSSYVYSVDAHRIVLLSGKQSGNLEVRGIEGSRGEPLQVTGLARTLIDIVVRPGYGGGITQVVEAYRGAKGRVRGDEIRNVLERLEYVYPYHQSVGFVLELAGYPEADWNPLLKLGTKFDFYLLHGMKQAAFNPRWRLFHPEGMEA